MPGFLTILALFVAVTATAQDGISVKSFRSLPQDMDARVNHPVTDQNGDKAALIKVVTTETGFKFEAGMLGIVKTEQKTSEIWVYVPYGSRKITIKHPQLGVLRNYVYPEAIKKATVYEMVLTTGKVVTTVEEREVPSQYIIITSEPTGATVYIDEQQVGSTTFQRKYEEGEYMYRVEMPKYHPSAGKISLKDEKEQLHISLKPNFGSIEVTSSPESGMDIYLDDEFTGLTTPASLKEVPSGEHELQLRSQWYQNQTKLVMVKDTQVSKLDFDMAKTFANVEVNTEPEARIMLDGKQVGKGHWQKRMHPGIYELRIEKDRYHPEKRQVEIVAGEDEQLNIALSGITGSLDVVTEPFNAEVFLDGKPKGTTPLTIGDLLIGTYTLTIKKQGYANLSKSVEITENENTEVNEILTDGKQLSILTNPPGAEVSVDGTFAGTSPLTTALSYGKHEITAVSGDMEKKKLITLDKSYPAEMTIHLQKQIKITSVPSEAEVYIDDELKGSTPLEIPLEDKTQVIELRKSGYKEERETIRELPADAELSYALTKIRILSGSSYDFQLGFGPEHGIGAYGGRMAVFTNRWYLAAGLGFPAKVQAFGEDIPNSHQQVLISDIDTYEPVARQYEESSDSFSFGEEDSQFSNLTLSLQVGYQFVSPFPFFVHAGYGARVSPYYENVYQAKYDYIPQDTYSSTEIKKGEYFTTATGRVDGFNSLILGVDVPLAKSVMLGLEYWSNTETDYTIYLSLGLIL